MLLLLQGLSKVSLNLNARLCHHLVKSGSLTLAQMPQPIHKGSEILAILLVGSTSIQSFPVKKKNETDPFSCL